MIADPATVLVIDDEPPIRRLLKATLVAHEHRVVEAATAREALMLLRHERPNLVLLDLGLPDMDGQALLQAIRAECAVPVIVLSSRGGEADKVAALDGGADDYVTKPFGAEELLARIRAALRHRLQQQGAQPAFESGDLSVDLVHRRVKARGQEVHLSPKEYDILEQFVLHAGKVLTHRHLLRAVWGRDSADPQYLRVYVRQLRQKLEADPERPAQIVTEAGVGYRLLA